MVIGVVADRVAFARDLVEPVDVLLLQCPPNEEEEKAGLTAHGEGAVAPYALTVSGDRLTARARFPIAGLEFERRSFELLFATDDCREGMQAFLEKRKPTFTGQ